jgi:hypothetical protein
VRAYNLFTEAAQQRLDTSIHATRRALAGSPAAVDAFFELVHAVRGRTKVLAREQLARDQPEVVRALSAMALYRTDWLRPVEAWSPPGGSMYPVLASLAEHLFARYPMPRFLASVWRSGNGLVRLKQHTWYVRLGRGESLRRLELPIALTRAMAHRFAAAPDHLTMTAALRWAQVTALGGSEPLVRALLATRLGRSLEHDAVWTPVVAFLARAPELPVEHVAPIVDFIQHHCIEERRGLRADGSYGPVPPPWPDFALKGRTPASLMRLVTAWQRAHGALAGPDVVWPRAPIREFVHIEHVPSPAGGGHEPGEPRVWTITELCSRRALCAESQAMQHCVRIFAVACRWRRSSVWSLQLETRRGRWRAATIHVRLATRRIVDVRRKLNRRPSQAERLLIARWAAQEGLVLKGDACR